MKKEKIHITIDETPMAVAPGTTIMEAAEQLGIRIPRLCYHPDLSLAGSCRVCIVDVKGMGYYMTACSVEVWEGMEIQTNSPEIRQARRDIVELLLDNHPQDCQTCERDGNCELQNLAYSMGVRERLFEGKRKQFAIEDSSHSVVRNAEKCILCGRCVRVCAEIQGVFNLSQHGRGFHTVVGPAHLAAMDDSVCIQCGQCINVCPTAAFLEKRSAEDVWKALADPKLHVVVQTAPSIRAAIGEGFGLPPGTVATGKMITALRALGFDAVFDTDFGADLTIVEEAHEFLTRLKEGPLPMITSCSPGWINFMEKFYPELIPHASTCKSPMSMVSTLAKTYYAEKKGIDPSQVYMVAVMPCVAKKHESRRPEHLMAEGTPYTDAVLTTREMIWMIKCYGLTFDMLPDGQFDSPLGVASGAGDIFGTTGGVMEATLRAAAELVTGKPADRLEFTEVRAVEGLRQTYVAIGDRNIHVGVANGLTNAKVLLDKVKDGKEQFHVIEVMACPGGCIGGGGQPYPPTGVKVLDPELLRKRAGALYTIDTGKKLRKSYENPAIEELYDSFLGGPGSKRAHELLHTHYSAKLPRGIR
ncbi:MAG: 4Fe-4S dicluster domain-containing protein [Rhodopirellula sp.]|nr:4Fe-4S dicluster domain-containing protein [Rhodopirellula sp.]